MDRCTIIYTHQMLVYLIKQGFLPIGIINNPLNQGKDAWVFKMSQELNVAMSNYSKAGGK